MPFQYYGAVRYYTFDILNEARVTHGVFTRQGGVSPSPWAELNVGGTVGDDPARVRVNRQRVFEALHHPPEAMYDVWQVHSGEVVIAHAPRQPHVPHEKADAILTNQPGVALFMRFADCVPILLYDPIRRVIGIAHAGWQGTLKGVVRNAVRQMQQAFGVRPADVLAAIGPSIAAHHYPVGAEVAAQAMEAFGADAPALLNAVDGEVQFDLWAANRLLLEQCGVRQIEMAGICTACHLEDWFSHRGEGGKTGRFGVLISLGEG